MVRKRIFVHCVLDIEHTGGAPGIYSILSLGACGLYNPENTFYAELKPGHCQYRRESVLVASRGLKCLEGLDACELDPSSDKFDPQAVIDVLQEAGEEPKTAMERFKDWVYSLRDGTRTAPAALFTDITDCAHVLYQLTQHLDDDIFEGRYFNINNLLRGATRNLYVYITDIGIRKGKMPHNALEDAMIHREEIKRVIERWRIRV